MRRSSIALHALRRRSGGRGGLRAMALGLVAFQALAAGRALVPDLCATQQALDAGVESAACCGPTACAPGAPAPEPVNGPQWRDARTHADCAFCHLATAPIVVAAAYAPPEVPGPDAIPLAWMPGHAVADVPPATNVGRDPPLRLPVR